MKNTAAIALVLARASAQSIKEHAAYYTKDGEVIRDMEPSGPGAGRDPESQTAAERKGRGTSMNGVLEAMLAKDAAVKEDELKDAAGAGTGLYACTSTAVGTAKDAHDGAAKALADGQEKVTKAVAAATAAAAAQAAAAAGVAAADETNAAALTADRAAALAALRLRVALSTAEGAEAAAAGAAAAATAALGAATTAAQAAAAAGTAAAAAKTAADNHAAFELAERDAALAAMNAAALAWTGAATGAADADFAGAVVTAPLGVANGEYDPALAAAATPAALLATALGAWAAQDGPAAMATELASACGLTAASVIAADMPGSPSVALAFTASGQTYTPVWTNAPASPVASVAGCMPLPYKASYLATLKAKEAAKNLDACDPLTGNVGSQVRTNTLYNPATGAVTQDAAVGSPCNPAKSCKADADPATIRCTPATAGNVPLLAARNVALAAAEAAYAIKESMLTAYCAQGMALGAAAAALKDGSNVGHEYAMGSYKSAADSAAMGEFQFGKLTDGSALSAAAKAYYRCATTVDAGITAVPADASQPQLVAPGGLTAHAQRHYGGNNTPDAASPAEMMKTKLAAAALADFRWTPANGTERDGAVDTKYSDWRTQSDLTVTKFKTMITHAGAGDADNGFTSLTTEKGCNVAAAAFGGAQISNVATTLDAASVAAAGAFDGVLDAAGAQLTIIGAGEITGDAAAKLAAILLACEQRCVALPGYAYYTAAQCRTPGNCCAGTEVVTNVADSGEIDASILTCKFMSGPHAVTASAGADGKKACRIRQAGASTAWQVQAALAMNDSANKAATAGAGSYTDANAATNGDRASANGNLSTAYTAFAAEVAGWIGVREVAMAQAQAYLVAKRLNARLAAAYKRTYDVYAARHAAYDGADTGGSPTITGKSAKAAYDAGALLVSKVYTSDVDTGLRAAAARAQATADAKKATYDGARATFVAAAAELAAQTAIAAQAATDAGTTADASAAAKLALSGADNQAPDAPPPAACLETEKQDLFHAGGDADVYVKQLIPGGVKCVADALGAAAADRAAQAALAEATTVREKAKADMDIAVAALAAKKQAVTDAEKADGGTDTATLKSTFDDKLRLANEAWAAAAAARAAVEDEPGAALAAGTPEYVAATGLAMAADMARAAHDEALLACKTAAWQKYRDALAAADAQRGRDITALRALLKQRAADAPKYVDGAGEKGARCEKALSRGSRGGRAPAQALSTCKNETDCCGAAKKADQATGLLVTVEVCWPKDSKTYDYQPARAPMAVTMPATETWAFACIEGAKKLAAATAAVATAAYMMA